MARRPDFWERHNAMVAWLSYPGFYVRPTFFDDEIDDVIKFMSDKDVARMVDILKPQVQEAAKVQRKQRSDAGKPRHDAWYKEMTDPEPKPKPEPRPERKVEVRPAVRYHRPTPEAVVDHLEDFSDAYWRIDIEVEYFSFRGYKLG